MTLACTAYRAVPSGVKGTLRKRRGDVSDDLVDRARQGVRGPHFREPAGARHEVDVWAGDRSECSGVLNDCEGDIPGAANEPVSHQVQVGLLRGSQTLNHSPKPGDGQALVRGDSATDDLISPALQNCRAIHPAPVAPDRLC